MKWQVRKKYFNIIKKKKIARKAMLGSNLMGRDAAPADVGAVQKVHTLLHLFQRGKLHYQRRSDGLHILQASDCSNKDESSVRID